MRKRIPTSDYECFALELYNLSCRKIGFKEYLINFRIQFSEADYHKMIAEKEQINIEATEQAEKLEEEQQKELETEEKQRKKRKRHYTKNSIYKYQNKKFYIVTRQMAFDRDKNKCVECGREEYLEAHHIVERCKGGTDDISNLMTLCPLCHAKHHKGQPVYRVMIKRARQLFSHEAETA